MVSALRSIARARTSQRQIPKQITCIQWANPSSSGDPLQDTVKSLGDNDHKFLVKPSSPTSARTSAVALRHHSHGCIAVIPLQRQDSGGKIDDVKRSAMWDAAPHEFGQQFSRHVQTCQPRARFPRQRAVGRCESWSMKPDEAVVLNLGDRVWRFVGACPGPRPTNHMPGTTSAIRALAASRLCATCNRKRMEVWRWRGEGGKGGQRREYSRSTGPSCNRETTTTRLPTITPSTIQKFKNFCPGCTVHSPKWKCLHCQFIPACAHQIFSHSRQS